MKSLNLEAYTPFRYVILCLPSSGMNAIGNILENMKKQLLQ